MPIKPENMNGDFETVDFVKNRHIIVYDNIQNETYPMHWHNSIEIVMPLSETYVINCSEEKFILNEREILIIPAGTLHQIDAQKGRRIFLLMDYNTISCNPALNYVSDFIQSPIYFSLKEDSEILSKLNYTIQEIYREYFDYNITTEIYVYIKFLTLLYDVIKCKILGNKKTEPSESDKVFEMTIKYIVMKLDENERGNQTRLMKVKDMILVDAIEEKREKDEEGRQQRHASGFHL